MDCDVVVLGAGPAGEAVAARAAGHGFDVVLVERELVGGECAFWACMPSKALLRPGELLDETRRVPGVREAATAPLDPAAVLRRRDEVVRGFEDAAPAGALEKRGVRIVRGHGRLAGERRVEVGDTVIEARRGVVLATGSAAALPPVDGLADAGPWTSREGTTARDVPARLVVLGGGVVGVELAQAWASLGTTVTLLEAQDRLLAGEEEFAGAMIAAALHRRGIEVRTGVAVAAVRREGDGVTVTCGGDEVHADEILVAAGRRPRVEDLGLEALGLDAGGPVEVDDTMRVPGHPWLYAIGDVNGRALLTHAAKYQARVAADVIAGRDVNVGGGAGPLAPRIVFTDPGLAAVGHTLASAEEAGLSVRAVDHPTDAVAGGSFHGHGEDSRARLVVDEDRGVLAGATFVAPEAAELIHAATVAVTAEVPLTRLWEAVPAFPTRSEVWLRLLEKCGL
jgi:pyruvate/2-oxoglutarate dehydrogenase complex dihydrolipoamide dehydrogenase (E3) component